MQVILPEVHVSLQHSLCDLQPTPWGLHVLEHLPMTWSQPPLQHSLVEKHFPPSGLQLLPVLVLEAPVLLLLALEGSVT